MSDSIDFRALVTDASSGIGQCPGIAATEFLDVAETHRGLLVTPMSTMGWTRSSGDPCTASNVAA